MYSFNVDFHEGAIRLTITESRGWWYRLLTGGNGISRREYYFARAGAIQVGRALLNQAAALGAMAKPANEGRP
jgi:hypothetical protein